MSIDTHMLLRTPLSAQEVRTALIRDPILAELGFVDVGILDEVGNQGVSLIVRAWDEDDRYLIDNGFETSSLSITFIPANGKAGWEPYRWAFAGVLRVVPGDVCAQEQGGGPLGLLRLDDVVYVNPNWIIPSDLTDYGYHPERIVVGIPPLSAEVVAG